MQNLTKVLDSTVSGRIEAGWPVPNVSFSLAVVSHDQGSAAVPLWEYHHLAKANINGTRHLNRDSQYLIGSISKVVSALVLLKSGVDPDQPVAKYLPQLNKASSSISWNNLTLRALASHMSGAPTNCALRSPAPANS